MSEQRYIVLTPHEDNVNEAISAEHVNELQDAIHSLQSEMQRQSDDDFMSTVLFVLENATDSNAMIADLLKDESKLDLGSSVNIQYIDAMDSVALREGFGNAGILKTKALVNPTGRAYKNIRLIVNEFKPEGTGISYEISFDGLEWYAIVPGSSAPVVTEDGIEQPQLFLRATFTSTEDMGQLWELPRLDGYAVLYQDGEYMFRYLEDGLDVELESSWDGTIIP